MESELEKRIQQHIQDCERYIRPSNNPIVNKRMQEKIIVFRSAPRDILSLERAIRIKKRQLKAARIYTQTDKLVNELEALETIREFIGIRYCRKEKDDQAQNPGCP